MMNIKFAIKNNWIANICQSFVDNFIPSTMLMVRWFLAIVLLAVDSQAWTWSPRAVGDSSQRLVKYLIYVIYMKYILMVAFQNQNFTKI